MMDISNPATVPTQTTATGRPGADVGMTLREAREALGMSVHDVAERIKFAPRQVEALEANDFAHLPQATFLRGFVRSYARVLQLDETALLAALPGEPPRQLSAGVREVNVAFPTISSLRGANVLWLAGAVGVAILLGLFVFLSGSEPSPKLAEVVVEPLTLPPAASAVVAAEEEPGKPEPLPVAEPKKPTEVQKAPESPKVPEPKKAPAVLKTPEPAKTPPVVATPAPQTEAASAAPATIPLEVLKRRPLHFVFKESSWTEVLDSRGVVLLSRTNPRGTEKWVGGPRHEPYDISIAHPANVRLYYRGKEIDLSAYAGMDVVHLKLE